MAGINRDNENLLDWDTLYNILDYNEDTGIFTWKIRQGSRALMGSIAGSLIDKGYIGIRVNSTPYKAHRLAWFYVYAKWPEEQIDHIDRNKTNNAISNLRLATNSQNQQNMKARKDNNSGSIIPGVSYAKTQRKKYIVQLNIFGKRKRFGSFKTLEEAEEECLKQRIIHYPFNTL